MTEYKEFEEKEIAIILPKIPQDVSSSNKLFINDQAVKTSSELSSLATKHQTSLEKLLHTNPHISDREIKLDNGSSVYLFKENEC